MDNKPDLYFNTAGLFRCCIKSLQDWYLASTTYSPQEGNQHICISCQDVMVYRGGVWMWARHNLTQETTGRNPPL